MRRATTVLAACVMLLATPAIALKGPDGKKEGQKTSGYAYLVEVPQGKTALVTFVKNAGGEVAGLLHDFEAQRRFHRAGNPRSEAKNSMDGIRKEVAGPRTFWVTCWFKQPGWKASAGWQQQQMKVIAETRGGTIQLGCEDRWGSPGTGGNEDWNDLEITIKIQ